MHVHWDPASAGLGEKRGRHRGPSQDRSGMRVCDVLGGIGHVGLPGQLEAVALDMSEEQIPADPFCDLLVHGTSL